MPNIIRRPDFAGGGITVEEKAAMDAHAKMWIARAMRTDPIEPDKITATIKGLYRTANLAEPIVVIAPSPLVMALSYGFAAAIWYLRNGDATLQATHQATYQAIHWATLQATLQATSQATEQATYQATLQATSQATSTGDS